MNRRRFLRTTGGLAAVGVGLSGCLNNESTSQSPPESNGGNSNDNDQSQNQDDQTDNTREKERILEAYNDGAGINNNAVDTQQRATDAFDNENYEQAADLYAEAESEHRRAEGRFSDALNVALEIGHDEAQKICEEAMEYSTLYAQAAQASADSAEEAIAGDVDRANELVDQANSYRNQANRLNPRAPTELKRVLNL